LILLLCSRKPKATSSSLLALDLAVHTILDLLYCPPGSLAGP
jgi:hypothetical protein